MNKDLSNETVFILAVLAILISVLGAATVFYETGNVQAFDAGAQSVSSSSGSITLEIVDPADRESSSLGSISLDVVGGN
jgi:hypothetical protein